MHQLPGLCCAPVWMTLATIAVVGSACTPVKEDRSITWSAGGENVGFQHGEEGVFVADREGKGLERVYQPGPDILATSTPLWSPTDGRLIFTTARDANSSDPPTIPRISQGDPTGDAFVQMPVLYTCWLREESRGEPAEPRPLFEAACDHVGYIAANLAVRWYPSGGKLLLIDQVDACRHGLFTFDLATGAKERIPLATADALVFDWSPDNEHLACAMLNANDPTTSGIWIGRLDSGNWWHVPGSADLSHATIDSPLERLKASRPAWSREPGHFAFVTGASPDATPGDSRWQIHLGDLTSRNATLLAEGDGAVEQLTWSPHGDRIGMLRNGDTTSLAMLGLDGKWLPSPASGTVRQFAGWDTTGRSIAFVTADDVPYSGENWASLLVADPRSRDRVLVAAADAKAKPQELISGMRVTFPRWSPSEKKLSLWFTFSPSHRSLLSRWLGWGLLPGDPAAIINLATGRIDWMAVTPWEEAQIGHYHLLKRDYAEAWRRYERARADDPAVKQATTANDYINRLRSPRGLGVFEYVCLRHLGREAAADERLADFLQSFPPNPASLGTEPAARASSARAVATTSQPVEPQLQELFRSGSLTASLLQDLYIAEVCLSIDAVEDAEDILRKRLKADESRPARLGAAIVLAQLLLLQKRHDEFVDLAVENVLPLLAEAWQPQSTVVWPSFDAQGVLVLVSGLTLLPLASNEFLNDVDASRAARLAESLEKLRSRAADDIWLGAMDAGLAAAFQRVGNADAAATATARLQTNPFAATWGFQNNVSERVYELRRHLTDSAALADQ